MKDRLLTDIPRSTRDFVGWLNRSADYPEEAVVKARGDSATAVRVTERVISEMVGETIDLLNALSDPPKRPVRQAMLAARRFLHGHFLTSLLSNFPMVRVIDTVRGKEFPFRWVPVSNEHSENERIATITHAALHLAERGVLWKVRQCPICRVWFESRDRRKRACSRRCKEKAYNSDLDWRLRRRRYMRLKMREWRKLNKERDARARQRARTGRTLPC
jgi:hypothetical protein